MDIQEKFSCLKTQGVKYKIKKVTPGEMKSTIESATAAAEKVIGETISYSVLTRQYNNDTFRGLAIEFLVGGAKGAFNLVFGFGSKIDKYEYTPCDTSHCVNKELGHILIMNIVCAWRNLGLVTDVLEYEKSEEDSVWIA